MRVFHTALKMALVGFIASMIAQGVSLDFWTTAGILAILSIHLTKRDSVIIAIRRFIDVVFGLLLATLLFIAFGYNFYVFSIFVFLFAYLSWAFKMSEGIVPGLVLIIPLFMAAEFSVPLLANQLTLTVIAIGVATIFNIFYPTASEKKLKIYVSSIDQLVKEHLFMLSLLLKDPEYNQEYYRHYRYVDKEIKKYIDTVELVDKDMLFQNDHSYLAYFHMRKEQNSYIRHMYQQALKIKVLHPYTLELAAYITELSLDIGTYDKASPQLKKLEAIYERFKKARLPKTRIEFETRARLYQILNEVESLLLVKIEFHESYPLFWKSPTKKGSRIKTTK